MSITIETDLKDILNRLEQRFDKIGQRFYQLDRKLEQKLDILQKDVTDLKIGQTKLEGEIRTLDERLTGKIETLDERLTGEIKTLDERLTGEIRILDAKADGVSTRIGNQAFISRAILGRLIIIIFGGGISMFAAFIPLK